MARLLVYAGNTPDHPDPKRELSKFRRGDVISIVEDGVFLGADPESGLGGIFRIIEIPGHPVDDPRIVALLHRESFRDSFGETPFAPSGMITHKRQLHLDLDEIEGIAQTKLRRSLATGEKIVMETGRSIEQRLLKAIKQKRAVS